MFFILGCFTFQFLPLMNLKTNTWRFPDYSSNVGFFYRIAGRLKINSKKDCCSWQEEDGCLVKTLLITSKEQESAAPRNPGGGAAVRGRPGNSSCFNTEASIKD